ncbi:hypothetical protein C0991_000126 [Blastosporella zonata]|nr:hypothetical protein C0991_000126 [Blastosporella zonata]
MDELKPYHGLNSKTAKSIVSGLQHDASVARLKMLELERANKSLSISLQLEPPQASATHPELTPYSTLPQPSSAYSVPSVYSPNVSANAKHCTQL